jgi:hypothetical protein
MDNQVTIRSAYVDTGDHTTWNRGPHHSGLSEPSIGRWTETQKSDPGATRLSVK